MSHQENEHTDEYDLNVEEMSKITVAPIEEDQWEEQKIVFFCTECEKLVNPQKKAKKLKFYCPECKSENVAYGTEKSICDYFHLQK